jgi:riboflavin biosynthesis pyrimidine reductase
LRRLPALGIHSLVVEGGAVLHTALWDAGLVDYVQLYEAPVTLGPRGVPMLGGRSLLAQPLFEQRVTALGPDVLTEGYVHRPD